MKMKFAIPLFLIALLSVLACSISLEGISIGDPPEQPDPFQEMIAQETFEAMLSEEPGSVAAEATAEPEYRPVQAAGSNMESAAAGSHEYSITANNFNCTCQETADMTVDIKFTGSQVEITNGGGGATMVYDKVGENTYQKTEMGYYLLKSGEGDQATETKVEQEDRTVIIFTNSGYVMENYKGEESSPCCTYTFKKEK
jgi:hypothetical protein